MKDGDGLLEIVYQGKRSVKHTAYAIYGCSYSLEDALVAAARLLREDGCVAVGLWQYVGGEEGIHCGYSDEQLSEYHQLIATVS